MYPYTTENEENTIKKSPDSDSFQGGFPSSLEGPLTKLKARVKGKHNTQGNVFQAQEYIVVQMEAPETHTVPIQGSSILVLWFRGIASTSLPKNEK